MVHHFPNFVCWREIFNDYEENRDYIYIDSFLCFLVGVLMGRLGNYFSGPQMAYKLFRESPEKNYFMLAENIEQIDFDKKKVLPYKECFKDDAEVLAFMAKVPHGCSLVIGVSSPKQNMLANYLYGLRPDLQYYCLGAAVNITWGLRYGNTKLRGSGLQWIEFLLLQPQRTWGKILRSVQEALSIFTSLETIRLFRNFIRVSKRSRLT